MGGRHGRALSTRRGADYGLGVVFADNVILCHAQPRAASLARAEISAVLWQLKEFPKRTELDFPELLTSAQHRFYDHFRLLQHLSTCSLHLNTPKRTVTPYSIPASPLNRHPPTIYTSLHGFAHTRTTLAVVLHLSLHPWHGAPTSTYLNYL